jgi:hypothetical protein
VYKKFFQEARITKNLGFNGNFGKNGNLPAITVISGKNGNVPINTVTLGDWANEEIFQELQ